MSASIFRPKAEDIRVI